MKLHFRGQCSCVLFEAPLFLVLLWLYYLIGLFLYFVVADNHIVVCVVVRVGVLVLLGCSKNIACFECDLKCEFGCCCLFTCFCFCSGR